MEPTTDDGYSINHPTSVRNSVMTMLTAGPASLIWTACSRDPVGYDVSDGCVKFSLDRGGKETRGQYEEIRGGKQDGAPVRRKVEPGISMRHKKTKSV